MSKYRCPICGATHKEQVANCRLCGQSMAPNAIPSSQNQVAQELHTDNGIKSVALIGLAIVAAIIIGAVIFGIVRAPKQLKQAQDVIQNTNIDGWAPVTSEQGKFTVEMPGEVTKETVAFAVTDDGKLVGATTKIPSAASPETTLLVGSGTVTLPAGTTSGTALSVAGAQNFIKDTLGQKWWTSIRPDQGVEYESEATAVAGYPAVTFRTSTPKATLNGKEAFAQVTFVLKGTTLYVIQTISIYKDAPQQDRMLSTFQITG